MAGKTKPKARTARKAAKAPAFDPEKVAEAVDFRTQGYGVRAIANEMGLDIATVIEMLELGLSEDFEEPAHFHTRLEIKRLQLLQQKMMESATAGSEEATKVVITLEQKIARAKLALFPDMRSVFGNLDQLIRQANLGPNKGGRPPHRPTLSTMAQVEGMAVARVPIETIAKILGTGVDQVKKHYAVILETARSRLIGAAAGTITTAIYNGNVEASFKVLGQIGPNDMKTPVAPTFDRAKTDPAGSLTDHEIIVHGGLPQGSTPENPGGDAQAKLDDDAASALVKPPGDNSSGDN
jgi:hypothetical protein